MKKIEILQIDGIAHWLEQKCPQIQKINLYRPSLRIEGRIELDWV